MMNEVGYRELSVTQRRQILYKMVEIYLNDDIFLNSIENLDDELVSIILDFIFSKDKEAGNKKRVELGQEFKLNLSRINDIKTKSNKLIRNYNEFIEQNEELKELLDLESQF